MKRPRRSATAFWARLGYGARVTQIDAPPAAWPTLDLLACPACGGSLRASGDAGLSCLSCARHWPERHGWLDFRPQERLDDDWRARQESMEGWYENLITNSDQAQECYRHDYEPLAPLLGELRGLVLDVGGGNGIARQYLPADVHYVDVDPSVDWLREDWLAVSEFFPALLSPITFVRGIGERLPFRSGRADVVLSLFSINHVVDPARVVAEALRVLRPGGRFVIVAEDVEPRWRDLPRRGYRTGWVPLSKAVPDKLATTLRRRSWPLHPEHVRTTERQLRAWLRPGFALRRRSWVAGWLTLDAVKSQRDEMG
jgi:SAM-dependent methyltransferase